MERRTIAPIKTPFAMVPNKIISKETKDLNQTQFKQVFHMVKDGQNKQGEYVILWPSKRVVKGEEVESQFLGEETTTRWIVDGRDNDEEGDILQLLPDGKIIPSYLPDLSDLALLPVPIKATARWFIKNGAFGGNNDCCRSVLEKLIWQSPKLQTEREWAWVHEGSNVVKVASYLDTFKVLMLSPTMKVAEATIMWQRCTSNHLDGRKWDVNIRVVPRTKRFSRPKRYVIWNCKGMTRASFVTHMTHIIEQHSPDCVILLETRCSSKMAKCISRTLPVRVCRGSNAMLGEGGSSMIVISSDILIAKKHEYSNKKALWLIECQ